MSPSSHSSRSTSSSSFGKIPLSCQSDPKQRTYDPRYDSSRYDPRYTSTLSEPRSSYSSTSSNSSKSGRSSNSTRTPLSISHGSYSGESGSSKDSDARYYPTSFLDPSNKKPEKKPLSCQTKDHDSRYYQNSSYYRSG